MSFRKKIKIKKEKQVSEGDDSEVMKSGENEALSLEDIQEGQEEVEATTSEKQEAAESEDSDETVEEVSEEDVEAAPDPELVAQELREELESTQAERDDLKAKYIRALADFENFKKRSMKERSDLMKYQGEKIVADLLQVLDNLELALEYKDADPEKLKTGVEMIHKMFIDSLGRWDVRSKSGVGKPFDPISQNAISKVPSPDMEPGHVVSELKKAYYYKDKLIREAEVVVSAEVPGGKKDDEEAQQEADSD